MPWVMPSLLRFPEIEESGDQLLLDGGILQTKHRGFASPNRSAVAVPLAGDGVDVASRGGCGG